MGKYSVSGTDIWRKRGREKRRELGERGRAIEREKDKVQHILIY